MNYIDIVNFIFTTLFGIFGALVFHFVFFAITGIFFKKSFPSTNVKLRYGIIIPARNEEYVVGNLIESIIKSDYPADKLEIFLIAHNCTDNTAKIGRKHGVHVYEYKNPDECTMGYAFKHLFSKIDEDFGIDSFDGFVIFNADNVVSRDYFEAAIKNNEFLEYAQFVGNYYGTPKKVVDDLLNQGINVLLEIEVQGAKQVMERCPDAITIFMVPPSFEELEKRIRGRRSEPEDIVQQRLSKARSEMQLKNNYRYVVTNDTIENASQAIIDIITGVSSKQD